MKPHIRILLVLAVLTFMACGGGNSFKAQLLHLDSLLVSNPDSVYQVLEGMREEAQQQRKSSRMYYELLRADAQNKAYIDFTTDSVMLEVAKYYDHHGTANEQMRAHYLLGCTYRDLQDVPMELQCFQEATEKADTTSKDCDLYTLYAIYGQMAGIYHSQFLPEEELNMWKTCEKIARIDKDILSEIDARAFQVKAYHFMNMQDSVLSITNDARKRYLQLSDTASAARILCPAINAYLEKQQYDSAKTYINVFEKFSGYIKNGKIVDPENTISIYLKGLVLLHDNNVDSALICFYNLLQYEEKEAAYKGLLSLYEKIGNADSISKYAKLYVAANDSSFLGNNAQIVEQITAIYNYGRQSHIAELRTKEVKKAHQRLYLYISISTLILFSIIFYALRFKHIKNNEIIEKTKAYFEILTQKERLEKQISEITSSHKCLVEKNEKILEEKENELNYLQHLVDHYSSQLDLNDFGKRLYAFRETQIFARLNQSIRFKDNVNKLTESEWRNYDQLYRQYFPKYYNYITTNTLLNHDEKKVGLLLIFGFSPKELSAILNKTMSRISNIRTSINKKLFNVESAKKLDERLSRFF